MPVRASTVPPNSSLDHSVVGKGFLSPLLSHNRAGGQTNIKRRAYFLSRAAPFPTILHRVEKQNEKKAAQTPHQNYRHRDNRQRGRWNLLSEAYKVCPISVAPLISLVSPKSREGKAVCHGPKLCHAFSKHVTAF